MLAIVTVWYSSVRSTLRTIAENDKNLGTWRPIEDRIRFTV